MRHGIRQTELAKLIGYEQTYLSALETGQKGPPTPEFVDSLIAALNLSTEETELLKDALDASQTKLIIDSDMPESVFWMLRELRKRVAKLKPVQIRLIYELLTLEETLNKECVEPIHRLKRRKAEAPM